jgi:hypothetical protein
MKLFKSALLFLTILFIVNKSINSQVVCSLDELIKEIMEDLIDNGKLDCLRKSSSPNEADETEEQRARRIAANWDSDCSFEAEGEEENDWRKVLLENYSIPSLVDVAGNKADPPHQDFDDQADMCEIVRALVAHGKFNFGKNMDNISLELLDKIDCPGGDSQTQVCAANVGSFAEKNKWVVMLKAESLRVNGIPKYKIDNK